jgi:hypothetical protein
MRSAEDEVILAECEEWAGGLHSPLTQEEGRGLHDRVCANPDAWWRILQVLIADASNHNQTMRLGMAPLRATLECGEAQLLDQAVSIARSSSKMASALMVGAPCDRDVDLYKLFGREHVVSVWIRYHTSHNEFDFWAWEMAQGLVREDPDEAWQLILSLIEKAPYAEMVAVIGAGLTEDFIMAHAALFIDRIEEEASRNARLKEALANVWIMRLDPDLFDRIEQAAGVPLRRV